jgi:hypothetical protein
MKVTVAVAASKLERAERRISDLCGVAGEKSVQRIIVMNEVPSYVQSESFLAQFLGQEELLA